MSVKEAVKENTKTRMEEPKLYNVIMHNDDFTTMEFVVEILTTIFRKSQQEATRLMLEVHHGGKSVVGTYPRDIANSKAQLAMMRAKKEGFPFRVTVEQER